MIEVSGKFEWPENFDHKLVNTPIIKKLKKIIDKLSNINQRIAELPEPFDGNYFILVNEEKRLKTPIISIAQQAIALKLRDDKQILEIIYEVIDNFEVEIEEN